MCRKPGKSRQLLRVNLFAGQPGGLLKRLPDISRIQVGIVSQNIRSLLTVGEETETHRYWDTHATYTRLPTHNVPVKGDAIQTQ